MVEQTVRTFCKRLLLFVGPLLAVGALTTLASISTGEVIPVRFVAWLQTFNRPFVFLPKFSDHTYKLKQEAIRLRKPQILVLGSSRSNVVQGQPGVGGITVRKDGKVHLPVVGAVPAEGLTLTEFETNLRIAVARFIVDPQVSVEIMRYESQKFFVLGQVGIEAQHHGRSLAHGQRAQSADHLVT